MKKLFATIVTCGLVIGISFVSLPLNVEAASAVTIKASDGDYSTMGFAGTFYEMESKVRERLAEGHENPTEMQNIIFLLIKRKKICSGNLIGSSLIARLILFRSEPIWITDSGQIWRWILRRIHRKLQKTYFHLLERTSR